VSTVRRNVEMLIRLEGRDLPGASCGPGPAYPGGHPNIHVAVQRRNKPADLLGLVRGDAETAEWELECTATEGSSGIDVKGPFVQGGSGGRFIYLSWGVVEETGEFAMFRRGKLMLNAVPSDVLSRAVANGTLVGRFGLTDEKGNPTCAAMRPPQVEWSAT
jgi:hypothetical protein